MLASCPAMHKAHERWTDHQGRGTWCAPECRPEDQSPGPNPACRVDDGIVRRACNSYIIGSSVFWCEHPGICGPSYWARAVFPGIRTYPRKIYRLALGIGRVEDRTGAAINQAAAMQPAADRLAADSQVAALMQQQRQRGASPTTAEEAEVQWRVPGHPVEDHGNPAEVESS